MTGLEVVAATYLFAWARRRLEPAIERAGVEADAAAGLAMDRLHQLVEDKLGPDDRGVARLEREAAAGSDEPGKPAVAAVAAVLAAEAADDPGFAEQLTAAVEAIRAAEQSDSPSGSATASSGSFSVAGASSVTASGANSIAAGVINGSIGARPTLPGAEPTA